MKINLYEIAKKKKIKYFLISYVDFFGVLRSKLVPAHSIKEKSVFAPILGSVAITIYSGEVYGAYRTAEYYHP